MRNRSIMNDRFTERSRRNMLKALGGLGAAGLAGCVGTDSNTPTAEPGGDTPSGDDTPEPGQETEAPQTEVPMADALEYWEMSGSYGGYMDRYSEDTGVTFSHTNMGYDEVIDRMKTRLVSGQGAPSTALIEQKKTLEIASTGGLRDLRPRMEEAGIVDEFSEGHLNAVTGDDGSIYSVPDDAAPTMLYYRRDVWDEHELAPHDEIETWDQLIEEGQKLPDDIALLSLPAANSNLYWRFLNRMQGGQEFDEDGNIVLNSEEGLVAARIMNRLAEEGLVDRVANWSQQWYSGFNDGTITGYATGSWFYGTVISGTDESTVGDWRGFKLPAVESGGNRASNRGGSGLVIPSQLDEPEANRAWDFIKFVTANPEQNAMAYENEGNFTAHEPSWDHEGFDSGFEYFGGQNLGQIWIEQMPNIPGYRFTIDSPTVSTIINEEMRNMIDEGEEPETVLDRAAQRLSDRTGRDIA